MRVQTSTWALGFACLATCAMAQTESPVTLYGRIYVTFETVEAQGRGPDGVAPPVPRRNRVSNQAGRLGVRGSEDLGNEFRVFFQLETEFREDQNDTPFAARNSAVGLRSPWGSLLAGRWDIPLKLATIEIDPFGDTTLGGITGALNGSGVANVQGEFDRRDQNVIQYWSPASAPVRVRLSYSANEARTALLNPSRWGASVVYRDEHAYLAYGHDELIDNAFGPETLHHQKGDALAAMTDWAAVRGGAAYQVFARDGHTRQKAWAGNLVWTIGQGQLIYQHQDARGGGDARAREQPRCDIDAYAYQYNFSRRTFVIGQYAVVRNGATATCNFGFNPLAITPGQDPRGFALGVRHVF